MDVPVSLCAPREGRVGAREEEGREARGEDGVDEGVEKGGEGDFVDVQRESGQGEGIGEGAGKGLEKRGGREGEGVVHCCCCCCCSLWRVTRVAAEVRD